MEKLKLYIKESYDEMVNKVTWPSWSSLQDTTVLVLVATAIITFIIFIMDVASKNLMELIYNINF